MAHPLDQPGAGGAPTMPSNEAVVRELARTNRALRTLSAGDWARICRHLPRAQRMALSCVGCV